MQPGLGQDRGGEDVWNVATWKSDISSKVSFLRQYITKQVIPITWKHTLETQESYFVTVVKHRSSYDLSEEDLDNVDVIVEIVDEFIFNGGKELSALQELQLLEILCTHFQGQPDEVVRCLQFGTMFNLSPDDELKTFRCKMLAKLLSMSVALQCSAVLECVGIWIQKHRHSLQDILNLIQAVVHDYCVLVPTSLSSLESLIRHSALLTSQFITAVTLIYPMHKLPSEGGDTNIGKKSEKRTSVLPPRALLRLVANWITTEPGISLTAYPQHLLLLPNCRVSESDTDIPAPLGRLAVSPVAGLVRWSVLGPLCFLLDSRSETRENHKSTMLVFSQLQFGVLQTFLTAKKQMDERGQDCEIEPGEVMEEELDYRSLITVNDLKGICTELLDAAKKLPSQVSVTLKEEMVNLAVDRLAQVIQVADTTGCLSGTKAEFAGSYPSLPRTRLLNLVLQSG